MYTLFCIVVVNGVVHDICSDEDVFLAASLMTQIIFSRTFLMGITKL